MRPFAPVLALLALAACQGAPAPAPLPLSSTFPVLYTGRVAPAPVAPVAAAPDAVPAALAGDGSAVRCKAIVVEMPRDRARQWLPAASLRAPKPAVTESYTPASAVFAIARQPEPPTEPSRSLGVVVAAELLDAAMQDGMCELVTGTTDVVVRMDAMAVVTAEGQRAFVQAADLKSMGHAHLISDPTVNVFAYGHRYEFTPTRDGDLLQVAFAWHVAEPVLPIPVVKTPYASLEVPMLVEHHLTGTASVAPGQVFVVGAVPGREPGRVQVLCVAVDVEPTDR